MSPVPFFRGEIECISRTWADQGPEAERLGAAHACGCVHVYVVAGDETTSDRANTAKLAQPPPPTVPIRMVMS